MENKICPHCKETNIPVGAMFCPSCGKQLPGDDSPKPLQEYASVKPTENVICQRCGNPSGFPVPSHCRACGFPLPAQDPAVAMDPGKKGMKRLPKLGGNLPVLRKKTLKYLLFVLVGIAAIGGILFGGWWIWNNIPQAQPQDSLVEACTPVKPGDDFVISNPRGLMGELDKNTYFKVGEEYSISPGSSLVIPEGVTLVIEPGARVKFGQGSKMIVRGTLSACGQANRRILFSADTTTGSPGYWVGIEFQSAHPDSVIGHANIEYAGRDAQAPIWLEDTDLHIENVRFDSNQWYPISLNPDTYPRIRPTISVENGPQGWEVREGKLNKNRTWGGEQGFVINGIVEVDENANLTIQPGTWIKFQPGSVLNVFGKLSAIGSEKDRIVFTSVNHTQDERGLSGTAVNPSSGDWIGLRFVGRKAQSQLSFVDIRYAGGESQHPGCVWLSDANPTLKDINISNCATYSVSMDIQSQPVVENILLGDINPVNYWEIRGSRLEGISQRVISSLMTADGSNQINPVITGWIEIEEQASLQINGGVNLLFSGGDKSGLKVNGKIFAKGGQNDPVVMTSINDPAFNVFGRAQAGDWGGVYIFNSKTGEAEFNHISIHYAGAGDQGCISFSNASPIFNALSIRDCASYPISSDATSRPVFQGVNLSNNLLANQWEIRESSLEERAVWDWDTIVSTDGHPIIRHITGLVKVTDEATLNLKPGLMIKFATGKGLWVQGSLSAEGTEEQPIILTSWRDPEGGGRETGAQPGDWVGMAFEGSQSASQVSFVEIRYAGQANRGVGCLNLKESNPILNNVNISNCSYYPIVSDLASDPQVNGLTLVENQPANDWAIYESTLKSGLQRTWQMLLTADGNNQINRVATGWLTIDAGARLEITDGVILKFREKAGIISRGSLILEGISTDPVLLTSWRDPAISDQTGVQSGDWIGLVFDNIQGETRLSHVELRYAGGDRKPRGAIVMTSSSPRFSNLSIADSAWYPISVDVKSSPQMDAINLRGNSPADAVEVRGSNLDTIGETVWFPWFDADNRPLVRMVNENVVIGNDATLRLEAGTILKFGNNAGMEIRGVLMARDAVFTSLYDDQYPGGVHGGVAGEPVWQGIRFYGRKLSRIEDTTIRYARVAIWMEDATPTIRNASIENSWTAAISVDFSSNPEIVNINLSGNAINGMLLRGDALPGGTTQWKIIDSIENQVVRVIEHNLLIGPDSRLLVDPGVVIKFGPEGGLVIEGQLFAGQVDNPKVTFTSLVDDSVGGDTDNSWVQPNRGSWLGIAVNPNETDARLSLFNVEIRYAVIGLFLTNLSNWDYDELIISDSQFFGISCDALSLYLPEDTRINLENNGLETVGCPTPDREEESE